MIQQRRKRKQWNMKDKVQLLLIDNYDSFTYNLYDYLCTLGAECKVVRNDEVLLSMIEDGHFDGLVLSPGPKRPCDAGLLMDIIAEYHDKLPILGICLGMQAIGEYFGAKLVHAKVPVHGKTSEVFLVNDCILWNKIENPTTVMRYHSLILKDCPSCLVPIGWTAEKELMALQHQTLPIFGVQFHPESILTQKGHQMLNNWLALLRK